MVYWSVGKNDTTPDTTPDTPIRHLTTPGNDTLTTPDTRPPKPPKPTPDFPLFAHHNGQWSKKVGGKLSYFGPWADPAAALARYQQDAQKQEMVAQNGKPSNPRPDFPLYRHASGQWAKKVRGKVHYFGIEPQGALESYLTQKDALLAGLVPVQAVNGVTVKYLADHFLTHKEGLIASEELSRRTWADYKVVCDKLVAYFGKDRLVISLRPDDFAGLRKHFAKGRGLVTLWNDVTRTRVVFQHAVKKQLIDRPIAYGDSFEKPTKVKLRIAAREGQANVPT